MARFSYLFVGLALSLTTIAAPAQTDWPAKPARIVVGFAPGGATDISARIVAEQLTKAFSQTFLVENRPGASGMTGAAEVARSAPDGCGIGSWAASV